MKTEKINTRKLTLWICSTAMFMGLNIIMSSSYASLPVPGGHMYFNDVVICVASIILDPVAAFMVGGIGSFLGDLFFYPAPMFVSLVTHGLQAVVISLFSHKILKKYKILPSVIGVIIGAVIMVAGYTFGRAYVYSTPEYALLKLPYQIAQASIGAALGVVLCWGFKLKELYGKIINEKKKR